MTRDEMRKVAEWAEEYPPQHGYEYGYGPLKTQALGSAVAMIWGDPALAEYG